MSENRFNSPVITQIQTSHWFGQSHFFVEFLMHQIEIRFLFRIPNTLAIKGKILTFILCIRLNFLERRRNISSFWFLLSHLIVHWHRHLPDLNSLTLSLFTSFVFSVGWRSRSGSVFCLFFINRKRYNYFILLLAVSYTFHLILK